MGIGAANGGTSVGVLQLGSNKFEVDVTIDQA
jgi:hypothetical protein